MGAQLRRVGDQIECWLPTVPELCSHGIPLGATVVMLIDVGAGWTAEMQADDDWSFTVDIGMRRSLKASTRISGVPTVQRAGRTISIDFPMSDNDGEATVTGVATFIRLPRRPQDPPRQDFPTDLMSIWHPPEAPLAELLAAEPSAHGLQVDNRPELLNPAGILQGGVAALLAELAAQARLESMTGRDLAVTSFDVRYVTMGRVGPFEAVVDPIGSEMAVVKVLDRGADDAVVTHNLIGFGSI